MSNYEHIISLLEKLSREERTSLAHQLVQSLAYQFSGIIQKPTVNGGNATIIRTRIPVWTIIEAKKNGASDLELLQAFPSLNADDLVNALLYYRNNKAEIEAEIKAQDLEII